jgi:hypothetical protein
LIVPVEQARCNNPILALFDQPRKVVSVERYGELFLEIGKFRKNRLFFDE